MEKGKHRPLKINILCSKFVRTNIREINVTFVENLDAFRITAWNIRHGSKRKVNLVLLYVLNQI
jgi:hypothetical protein